MLMRHRDIKQMIVLRGAGNGGDHRHRILALVLGRFQLFSHYYIGQEIVDQGLGMSCGFNATVRRLVRDVPIARSALTKSTKLAP